MIALTEQNDFMVILNQIVTISIDQSGVKMDVEHYDKVVRMYKIKKEWEQKHIFH